jgi:hypothetical protein
MLNNDNKAGSLSRHAVIFPDGFASFRQEDTRHSPYWVHLPGHSFSDGHDWPIVDQPVSMASSFCQNVQQSSVKKKELLILLVMIGHRH